MYNLSSIMKGFLLFVALFTSFYIQAQDAIEFKTPPKAIYDLAMAKQTPSVSIDSKGKWMLILERSSIPGIDVLAQPELRIAGMRINPNNFALSRGVYTNKIIVKNIASGIEVNPMGLPENLQASNFQWSADERKVAFTHTGERQVDIYVLDVLTSKARKININPVNVIMSPAFSWVDNQSILYKRINLPASKAPQKPTIPTGPIVQQNMGKSAASATFQDLIKSPFDEALFEFYATAQLVINIMGKEMAIGKPAIYSSVELSPDNKYLLNRIIHKPFSYLLPASGFNSTVTITDIKGKLMKTIANLPSSELAPRGFDNVLNAPRGFNWIDIEPARVVWIEPLDSGLINNKMPFHDIAYYEDAPFNIAPVELVRTANRIGNIAPINEEMYLVTENSRAKHRQQLSKVNSLSHKVEVLIDRSTDDAYNDPGTPITKKNQFNRNVIKLRADGTILMRGNGASANGDMPFLNSFHLNTKATKTLWRCEAPYNESVISVLDSENLMVVTNRQSKTDAPNYFLRNLATNTMQPLTKFADPQPGLRNVVKQKITYKRKDGIDLAADLYLPVNYDPAKDGRLPVFMWAYPREYKSAADAAQLRGSQYTYTRISWGSPVYWATQGYAVMDNTEFPIVGEGDQQPNDNFVEQLVWNASAAVNKIVEMGIGDSNRIAVGGHSYGAFMTANLLAHTKLFKAGIARSGAYNRTLTPFGFQNEERTYWQAQDVYTKMSPFTYANQIKTPLLMIHGEADNNSGTFPIQSERLFNAIKGHGGIVRYIQLPFEAHSYASKENVLHMLWEMNEWLDKYVKKGGK
ncbi:MAG: prolyl oligopeptidase family serine peptidase [Ferruginibacter sp.]